MDNKSIRCCGIGPDAQALILWGMPWSRCKHFTVTHDAAERVRKALQIKIAADIVRHVVNWKL
jgi:hypothetical protein